MSDNISQEAFEEYQKLFVNGVYMPNHVAEIEIASPPKNNIIFDSGDGNEMLKITKDGFYVRGVLVEADATEAEQVYLAFKQWLTWANLSKNNEE